MEWFLTWVGAQDPTKLQFWGYVVTVAGFLVYVLRLRENIQAETKIHAAHFEKVKEFIEDQLHTVRHNAAERARKILADRQQVPVIDCPGQLEGETCPAAPRVAQLDSKLQLSRFMRVVDQVVDTTGYRKTVGWMRENGFHDEDEKGLAAYNEMRGRQLREALQNRIEERVREICPDLAGTAAKWWTLEEAIEMLGKITAFTIAEDAQAAASIKKYREAHGLNPKNELKKILQKVVGPLK